MEIVCRVCAWSGAAIERDAPYIMWCPGCSTGLTVPPPYRDIRSDGVWSSLYRDRLSDRSQWRREAERRVAWLRTTIAPPAAVLEIGSGTGEFVEAAEAAGYQIVGIEPSTWAAGHAREIATHTFCGDFAAYKKSTGPLSFSAVVMFHVLEHIPAPADLLREIRAVLTPGGVLLIEVPNAGHLSMDDDGTTWWMRSFNDHVHHFRPGSLARLLQATGFAPEMSQWTMQRAYGVGPTSLQRLRQLLRGRSPRSGADLLRAVARA